MRERPSPHGGNPGGGAPGARDAGGQPERTRLAWRRTTLAATVVGALAWRHAVLVRQPTAVLTAAGATVVWLVVLVVAHQRVRRLSGVLPPPPLAGATALLLACAAVTLAVVAGLGSLLV